MRRRVRIVIVWCYGTGTAADHECTANFGMPPWIFRSDDERKVNYVAKSASERSLGHMAASTHHIGFPSRTTQRGNLLRLASEALLAMGIFVPPRPIAVVALE